MHSIEQNGKTYLYPTDAADITPAMLTLAEEVHDDYFIEQERINWEDFLDHMARYSLHEEPAWEFDSFDNGAVRKIKKHIRDIRNRG